MTHDIPAPADAVHVEPWQQWATDRRRLFTSAEYEVPGYWPGEPAATVQVRGEQAGTGDVVFRYGAVSGPTVFTAEQLRKLAAACLDAADILDRLNE